MPAGTVLVLGALTGCAGHPDGRAAARTGASPLADPDRIARTVVATRRSLLAEVSAIQEAAAVLDRVDEACAAGQGVAARTARRVAAPMRARAQSARAGLTASEAAYARALDALARSSREPAVAAATAAGRSELASIRSFAAVVGEVQPRYDRLAADEQTWIVRALTPWYRSIREGADAYAVLQHDTRPALEAGRQRLAAASQDVVTASSAASTALRAADRSLHGR